MSNYKGLFTFDEDSHKYVPIPIAGAEGIIDAIGHKPADPDIKDEKFRKAFRAWAEACDIPSDVQLDVFEYLGTGITAIQYDYEAKTKPYKRCVQFEYISSDKVYNSQNDRKRTLAELCGDEEE